MYIGEESSGGSPEGRLGKRIVRHRGFHGAAGIVLFTFLLAGQELGERREFPIHLPTLLPYFKEGSNALDEVFITWGSRKEGWAVGPIDDRYVRDTRRQSLEHTHKEYPNQAYLITDFEAEQLSKVCRAFERTLSTLEKELHRKRWARLRHLDGYLSFFLRGFYYLYNAAKCSRDGLSEAARPPKTMWDEKLVSPKTDRRVAAWRRDPERVIRLRIAAKELIHQVEHWQEAELANKKRDVWEDHSRDFRKAYELFVKLYFGIGGAVVRK